MIGKNWEVEPWNSEDEGDTFAIVSQDDYENAGAIIAEFCGPDAEKNANFLMKLVKKNLGDPNGL